MIEEYLNGETVTNLALKYKVSKRSIITQLSQRGYYKCQTYKNKRGETPIFKAVYCSSIADVIGVDPETLQKVCKPTLVKLLNLIKDKRFNGEYLG